MLTDQLLKELVSAKLLDEKVAQKTEEEAKTYNKNIEDILYARNLVIPDEILKTKSKILKIPFKKVDFDKVDKSVFKLTSPDTISTYKLFPISREKDSIVFGVVSPNDFKVQEVLHFLGRQLKSNIAVFLVSPSDVESAIRFFSPFKDEVKQILESFGVKKGEGLTETQKVALLEGPSAVKVEDAPVIKLVATILKDAVGSKASDIHIEPSRKKLRIRFRIDGELKEVQSLPLELQSPVVSRIKVLANLRLDETRIPQDGRFRSIIFEKEIDFRIATFPTPFGEKVVLRLLDPSAGLKTLEDLGMGDYHRKILEEAMARPFGTVLSTGPTGSGKSTTLYAILQILNTEGINIVSLEDPVEYSIEGVNQSQVKPEIGYDFASGLRQILRQDPDVIMVGEVRDNETAGLAIHASLTGHLVLSTLHTNNSVGAIPRLVDMKVQPFLLPSTLNLMMAQRLVSRLCDSCKKEEAAASQVAEVIEKELNQLPKNLIEALKLKKPYALYKANGCSVCRNKGTIGRIAIFEMFRMTPELSDIINKEINENEISKEARRQGMISMRQDGIIKALQGFVSIEEVLRETEEI